MDFSFEPLLIFFIRRGDAGHEELVKVAAADGDEFYSFQQWMPEVTGFLEDSGVESYPAEFPV
jgi:hypothetical protein